MPLHAFRNRDSQRVKILRDLRKGEFDVLIGINLLREGLDLPEVSLVAILDADKEGFLRSWGSLIQTIGRCARHLRGRAILYADRMTDSMKRAIDETLRRREIQTAYNMENGITPESIIRPLDMTLAGIIAADYTDLTGSEAEGMPEFKSQEELDSYIVKLESDMREAAKRFEFEKAATLRDTIRELRTKEFLFAWWAAIVANHGDLDEIAVRQFRAACAKQIALEVNGVSYPIMRAVLICGDTICLVAP